MSRRRFKYLSLLGHIDGTVLDMHDTASPVILPTYNKHFSTSSITMLFSVLGHWWFSVRKGICTGSGYL